MEKLLDALSVPWDYCRLHAAGNDAFFALKGLLTIAARDMTENSHRLALRNQQTINTQTSVATILGDIGRAPYPLPACKPKEIPVPPKPPKLSIGAKRRLRQERKANRRAEKTLASTGVSEQDADHGLDSIL